MFIWRSPSRSKLDRNLFCGVCSWLLGRVTEVLAAAAGSFLLLMDPVFRALAILEFIPAVDGTSELLPFILFYLL